MNLDVLFLRWILFNGQCQEPDSAFKAVKRMAYERGNFFVKNGT